MARGHGSRVGGLGSRLYDRVRRRLDQRYRRSREFRGLGFGLVVCRFCSVSLGRAGQRRLIALQERLGLGLRLDSLSLRLHGLDSLSLRLHGLDYLSLRLLGLDDLSLRLLGLDDLSLRLHGLDDLGLRLLRLDNLSLRLHGLNSLTFRLRLKSAALALDASPGCGSSRIGRRRPHRALRRRPHIHRLARGWGGRGLANRLGRRAKVRFAVGLDHHGKGGRFFHSRLVG